MFQRWALAAPLFMIAAVTGSAVHAADDMTAQLRSCRTIANVEARAQCYDRIVDGQAPPPRAAQAPAPPAPPAARQAAAPPAPAAQPAQRFGEESLPAARRPAPENPEPESMAARITAISMDGGGKGVVTLDNGQVWRHLESDRMRLKAGDAITIRKGLVGNYLLIAEGLNRTYRVSRVK